MLRIRTEQKEAFAAASYQDFVARMIKHLTRYFPDARDLDEEALRERIHAGIARARGFGIRSEQGVCCFIDTQQLLGEQFDRDPQHAWAVETLKDERFQDPDAAARHLLALALDGSPSIA